MPGTAVRQHPCQPLRRIGGVQRQVGPAGLEDAQDRRHRLDRAAGMDGDDHLRPHAPIAQPVGHGIRPPLQLPIGKRGVPDPQCGPVGGHLGLLLELPMQQGGTGRERSRGTEAVQPPSLARTQHPDRGQRPVGIGHGTFHEGQELAEPQARQRGIDGTLGMADGQERPPRLLPVGEIEAGGTGVVDREPGPGRRVGLGGEGAGERQPALAVGKIRLAQAVLPQEAALEAVPEPLPARTQGELRPEVGRDRQDPGERPRGLGHLLAAAIDGKPAQQLLHAQETADERRPQEQQQPVGGGAEIPAPRRRAGPAGRRSTARSGGPDRCRPAARTAAAAARGGSRSARARTPCPAGRPRPPGARPATRHSRHTAAPRPARPRALPAGPPGPGRAAPASAGPGCRAGRPGTGARCRRHGTDGSRAAAARRPARGADARPRAGRPRPRPAPASRRRSPAPAAPTAAAAGGR